MVAVHRQRHSEERLTGTVVPVDVVVYLGGRHDRVASRCRPRPPVPVSEFARFRLPPEVIVLGVHWYLRFALSYRDVEELFAERDLITDHVTV